jgi:tetrahydromethanopterin S-methyltransferase subunit E
LGVSVTKKEIVSDGTTTKWIEQYVGDGNTGLTFGITMFFCTWFNIANY